MTIEEQIEKRAEIRLNADILLSMDISSNANGIALFQTSGGKYFTNKINRMTGIVTAKNFISEDVAVKIFDICRAKYQNREDLF